MSDLMFLIVVLLLVLWVKKKGKLDWPSLIIGIVVMVALMTTSVGPAVTDLVESIRDTLGGNFGTLLAGLSKG